METALDRIFADRESFSHSYDEEGCIAHVAEDKKKDLILSVEAQVKDWLKSDGGPSSIQIKLLDMNNSDYRNIFFSKSEICVKTCKNVWDVWRIATSWNWPEIISYKVKEIGLNDYDENKDDKMKIPNQIFSEDY